MVYCIEDYDQNKITTGIWRQIKNSFKNPDKIITSEHNKRKMQQ